MINAFYTSQHHWPYSMPDETSWNLAQDNEIIWAPQDEVYTDGYISHGPSSNAPSSSSSSRSSPYPQSKPQLATRNDAYHNNGYPTYDNSSDSSSSSSTSSSRRERARATPSHRVHPRPYSTGTPISYPSNMVHFQSPGNPPRKEVYCEGCCLAPGVDSVKHASPVAVRPASLGNWPVWGVQPASQAEPPTPVNSSIDCPLGMSQPEHRTTASCRFRLCYCGRR